MQLNKDRRTQERQFILEQQIDANAIKIEELSQEVTDLRHHLDYQSRVNDTEHGQQIR